jgi:hypothetical protein
VYFEPWHDRSRGAAIYIYFYNILYSTVYDIIYTCNINSTGGGGGGSVTGPGPGLYFIMFTVPCQWPRPRSKIDPFTANFYIYIYRTEIKPGEHFGSGFSETPE